MPFSPDECARQVLQVIPMVLHVIRAEMRSHRVADLSVPQFRVLIYLSRHEGASISDVAEHMGLTLPSISKMVDGLVTRELVTREMDPGDRRRMKLVPTDLGREKMQSAYNATLSRLSERLGMLSSSERASIVDAMLAMESIFAPSRERKGQ